MASIQDPLDSQLDLWQMKAPVRPLCNSLSRIQPGHITGWKVDLSIYRVYIPTTLRNSNLLLRFRRHLQAACTSQHFWLGGDRRWKREVQYIFLISLLRAKFGRKRAGRPRVREKTTLARRCAKISLVICELAAYPSSHYTGVSIRVLRVDSAKTDCAKVHLSLNDIWPRRNGR